MNFEKNWDLQIDPGVFKALKKFPQHDAERLLGVIKLLSVDPYFGDIQKLYEYDNTWRRRVGAYRIFYRIKYDARIILIFHIERRTSKTY